ncbi:MAG TPA: aminotransferase class V-fold PLP-dependent enzyme [Cytophagaceae bacterium]|nr:aminotransferase class V-fold PLP-dependent enzyme [Cytophagaceae bacterium]
MAKDNKIYFTPGPSELYPTVPAHLAEALDRKMATISHRSKAFQEVYAQATQGLRQLLNLPDNYQILFLSSATEIWERILQNCVEHTSFHAVNGSFSKRFYEFSGELELTGIKVEAPFGVSFNADDLSIPAEAEIICLTQNETSSGAAMPVSEINKVKSLNPNTLIFVDAVSSLPFPDFDYSKIDSVFFSVQKCFGLPAGLGVWLLNDRCIEKAKKVAVLRSTGTYHTVDSMLSKALANQTPETPNVLNIFLLSKVVEDLNKIGAAALRQSTERKAKMIYDYLADSKNFEIFVKNEAQRSQTTLVADTKLAPAEVNKVLAPYDMAVGSGYGNYKEKQIRIANFPAHSEVQVEKLVTTLKNQIG